MKEMTLQVDHVPVEVKFSGSKAIIPNIFGMDGVESVKRHNRFNEPAGLYNHSAEVTVEAEEITVEVYQSALSETSMDEFIVTFIKDTQVAYPSVGWEFLTTIKN